MPSRSDFDTQPVPVPVCDPPAPRRKLGAWAAGAGAVLIIAGTAASYLHVRPAPAAQGGAGPQIPATLRPYYDRAQNGDPSAMRMLGTMYYNGLNVAQDTREGLRWYRKAAAAGSVAAKKDLEQLGAGQGEP